MECVTCVCDWLGEGWRCWGREDWVWALPILEEHGESGICVCVLIAVVWVGDREWVGDLGKGLGGWCESGFFVFMAGPGICILC